MANPSRPDRKPGLPSALPPGLKRALAVALALAAFVFANTAYLLLNRLADALRWEFFAVGETSLPRLYQAMVLAHTGAGLLLAAGMAAFAVLHLRKVWRRRHRLSVASGAALVAVGLGLAVTGLFILTAAASRDNGWAWWAHVACAALVPTGYVLHRLFSRARPRPGAFARFSVAAASLAALLVLAHGFTHREVVRTAEAERARGQGLYSGPGAKGREPAAYAEGDFVPAAFVPPESPFFPSAATTSSGGYLPSRIITRGDLGAPERLAPDLDEHGFVFTTGIGSETCNRCHPDIVAQWAASAHRFSSFNNPFYEATINDMRANATGPNAWVAQHIEHFPEAAGQIGKVKSKWCSACHDPALMLAGRMHADIDRRSPEAQAGLTCLACHAIDRIHNRTGNGNYNVADEQEDPYLFADAPDGSLGAFLHDTALKARPTVHKRQMLKPVFRQSEFCASCHKVSLDVPVNNYRWLRGQNEYDNWHDSGVARNAARTFYLPPVKRRCQDCHMPLEPAPLGDVAARDGLVRSHRFLAVNTALPFLRGDRETIDRIEAFLRDEKLRVDVFALRRGDGQAPVMALDRAQPALTAGDTVTVDVVVRNQGVGHTFPGGTNDSNEGWLEFSLTDDAGSVLAISGEVGPDGHLDPMAHAFKARLVDRHGNGIHRRNAQDIHVTVFANVIGPGTADIAHYAFVIPPALAGRSLTVRARLLWRKFDRRYTEFAYHANPDGFRRFRDVPDLPVTEIASDDVTLRVADGHGLAAPPPAVAADVDWVRYNDYGIGLLLEGDTRGAARAFGRVVAAHPDNLEGPLNLARTAIRDGNVEKAYAHLRQCERIQPGNARVAWVWGVVLQEDGRYAEAALAYHRVLEDFPEDRAAWLNLGRTYYLDRQYERALEALGRVLQIDPENRIAHYHRMLAYRALDVGRESRAAEEAYGKYRIDESAQEITRAYRLAHPGANLMSQRIRTHRLVVRPPAQMEAALKAPAVPGDVR